MHDALVRGWANLIARLDGPMHFRFIVQPLVAMLLGVRSGLRDAREGQPPFLSGLFWSADGRRNRIALAAKDLRTVFLMSVLLDGVYQIRVHGGIFALELLVTAVLLAVVPYVIVRGPITRLSRLILRRRGQA